MIHARTALLAVLACLSLWPAGLAGAEPFVYVSNERGNDVTIIDAGPTRRPSR